MKINPGPTYWNFITEKVLEKFNATKYIGEFDLGGYQPMSVYYSENPDRSLGHKDYFFLSEDNGQLFIGGKNKDEMEKYRYRDALVCDTCNTLIYSTYRHDCRSCECEGDTQISIDGGCDYTKISYGDNSICQHVKFDLIDRKIVN